MLNQYPLPNEQGSQNRPGKRARNVQDDQLLPLYNHQLPLSREPLTFTEDHLQEAKRKETRPADKEKNRRLSCKECRRLKLKCDRVFPCQSCVKRGCGSLCPEGALTSGRGSRFILANTEQLHEKIAVLGDRVRKLEDALRTLQATHSLHPHPLLSPDLLQIKTSQDLYITSQGQSQFLQHQDPTSDHLAESTNALSLSLASTQPPYAPMNPSSQLTNSGSNSNGGELPSTTHPPDVPPDILQLSSTFPFPWSVDLRIRKRIREALPPRHEALAICEAARNNALWQRLALLLMILSIGSLVDLSRPLGSLYGEAYHHLARAAVCEIPLMEEPDFDVLHCLFFMIWWHLIFSDNKKAIGYAWNLMGFVAKLAQGYSLTRALCRIIQLGLHRDNLRRRGIPEEDEKRRAVFWELLNLDARMSLSLGRPPSICLRHVDTKTPEFKGTGLYVPREEIICSSMSFLHFACQTHQSQPIDHEWKNAFFIRCLTPILEAVVVVEPPPYTTIVELDALVRNFEVPKILDAQPKLGSGPDVHPRFLTMQRALVATTLLQLHRKFFTEAMSHPETFDIAAHPYAPSVLATCLGAASLIESIETLFENEPQLSARFLYFWFNSYSAAATLALCVARSPSTPFASEAQKHVDRACRLFKRAGQILPLCRRLQHVTEKLADKSRQALKQWQAAVSAAESHSNLSNPENDDTLFEVPESFRGAHSLLVQCLEQQIRQQPRSPELTRANLYPTPSPTQTSSTRNEATWLPDVYSYANAGVGKELRYDFPLPAEPWSTAQESKTPFVLGTPRVSVNTEFNFDYGELKPCEETGCCFEDKSFGNVLIINNDEMNRGRPLKIVHGATQNYCVYQHVLTRQRSSGSVPYASAAGQRLARIQHLVLQSLSYNMRFENFEATINVKDSPLKEYEVTFDESTKQATCWIASEEGKVSDRSQFTRFSLLTTSFEQPFSIVYKPLRKHAFVVSGRMTVDGRDLGGIYIDAKQTITRRTACALSGDVARPFIFTALQVTDNQELAGTPSQALGEIKVEIWHIERGTQSQPGMVRDFSIDPTHENSKKQMQHHHQVNFGAEQSHNYKFYTSKNIEKLVTFVFKYRSMDVLMDNDIVPRPRTAISYREEKQKAADFDRMESDYYGAAQNPSGSSKGFK
ncbi:hypothetical protein H0H93_013451, partial [Arthromyces matolae]